MRSRKITELLSNRKGPEINIAPLVDMVFLLLIFFLVTTTFSKETGVTVNKPKAQTARSLTRENIMIAVTERGSINIHNREVDLRSLNAIVRRIIQNRPESRVVIIADENARTGLVVDVMDECKLAGAKKISLAARKER
jgi:biopolymer transport protein ExbD